MKKKFKLVAFAIPFFFLISCSDSNDVQESNDLKEFNDVQESNDVQENQITWMQQITPCITNSCNVQQVKTIAKKLLMT